MATIDKLLSKMVQQKAERVLLNNEAPIRLFAKGNQINGPVLSAAQLKSVMLEIIPQQLRSQLVHSSTFHFVYNSPSGAFDFNVITSNETFQVSITPQKVAATAVDLDSLVITFDEPTQIQKQCASSNRPPEPADRPKTKQVCMYCGKGPVIMMWKVAEGKYWNLCQQCNDNPTVWDYLEKYA